MIKYQHALQSFSNGTSTFAELSKVFHQSADMSAGEIAQLKQVLIQASSDALISKEICEMLINQVDQPKASDTRFVSVSVDSTPSPVTPYIPTEFELSLNEDSDHTKFEPIESKGSSDIIGQPDYQLDSDTRFQNIDDDGTKVTSAMEDVLSGFGNEVQIVKDAQLHVGDTLKNRFKLVKLLGEGGMGKVYQALDSLKVEAKDEEPHVAVKVLSEDFKRYPKAFVIFQREARKSQNLSHHNIIKVFDFDRDDSTGVVFMTMELLEGEPLDQLLNRTYPAALSKDKAMQIIKGMGSALEYAHQHNIIHSDVKPGNVFVLPEGDIKMLDFGISRVSQDAKFQGKDQSWLNPENIDAVTPHYASCEMLEKKHEAHPADDVYALACITYEVLTGHHPFSKRPCTQARDKRMTATQPECLSRKQWKALQKGLAFERAQRTQSITEFLDGMDLVPKLSPIKAWALVATGLVALAGIGLWGFELMYGKDLPQATPFEKLDTRIQAKVEKFLNLGDMEMEMLRVNEARDAYKQVLEMHPFNPRAMQGLHNIADQYMQAAKNALKNSDEANASDLIAAGLEVVPEHEGLLQLKSSL